ncbi:hypothetical protein [Gloeobacter morelensis]|uniref:hypothetical protein n=1 Tax=Gloeobacter morelensis TaxID=2907343 RepID=UPI001E3608AF|nr:hypothetical protein [Gloeobacter morelensis]UFP97274.1 hypothetical protein ISF26_24440 [Gloeobacter morelensis MG652769]
MHRPWQELAELLNRHKPGALERYHPRKYRTPKGYCSSLQVAIALASGWYDAKTLQIMHSAGDGGNAMRSSAVAHRLLGLGVPLYHVAEDFLEALLHTDLPTIPTHEVRWAMPGAVFLLPRGPIRNPNSWPVEHLAVATYGRGLPGLNLVGAEGDDFFGFSTSIAEGTDGAHQMSDYAGVVHKSQFATLDQMPDVIEGGFHVHSPLDPNYRNRTDTQAEQRFAALLRFLSIHLMLALGQPKRFVEVSDAPKIVSASRGFGKKQREATEEIWEPNWLGKAYCTVQESAAADGGEPSSSPNHPVHGSGGGTHARPRSHWRRGHWRRVPYGPLDANPRPVKRVLIDPVLVNPDVGTVRR